jgi:hypothetical protein
MNLRTRVTGGSLCARRLTGPIIRSVRSNFKAEVVFVPFMNGLREMCETKRKKKNGDFVLHVETVGALVSTCQFWGKESRAETKSYYRVDYY